ncbi:MAG TPA: bifunctional glycosyltransferase/class I SAM-dependent methyltransferase [Thermoanaerobaculia bacterium]|nr:bifunctional glycosyltransferase/class I SAM-dependent methyltransferase [Thermoanaerobaculia bacterium]
MSSTSVSVVLPLIGRRVEQPPALDAIRRYLETTGFTFEILTCEGAGYGAAIRKGCADAKGNVVVIVDPELPYPVSAIGDAVAMVQSGATDIVFAGAARSDFFLRALLVPLLPDPAIHLKAFTWRAMKLAVGETKLNGGGCDLEIAFLANKYGFRIERLLVHPIAATWRSFNALGGVFSAIAIRMTNRRMGYRGARRCPVCFSSEVWTCAQIPTNVVRACRRCKCRYLNQFAEEDDTQPVRRVLAPHPIPGDKTYDAHSAPAREKTSARRLGKLRKQLTARARLLEVGVRDGTFGAVATSEYEYIGIDPAQVAARHARARGLEVYCASLQNFVNTGPAFDAIAAFHVVENMPDPHDALGRIKDLLKPGGVLFVTTFDTEGLIYLMTERNRMAQNFRTHLILYSRSALIELLEHSGFEIVDIGPDFEYRDQKFVRHWIASRWPRLAPIARMALGLMPDPMIVSTGSIRIVAKRRAGPPTNVRAIRSVEPTHAR